MPACCIVCSEQTTSSNVEHSSPEKICGVCGVYDADFVENVEVYVRTE